MQMTHTSEQAPAVAHPRWGITDRQRRAVDAVLADATRRGGSRLAEPITRVFSGGKRLRPALALAVADGDDTGGTNRALAAAASVELLHWATLVHDDVIDDARSRHGLPTLNAREGLGQAVVTGDLLIGAAFELGAQAGPQCVTLLAQTLTALCVGQAREEGHRFDDTVSEQDVLAAITGKTGSLLQTAARLGAVSGELDAEVGDALGEFGLAFGVSLQILDDIMDLVSTPERLGKPVLSDFANGTITLPAVAAFRLHPELREFVRPGLSPAECDRAVSLLRDPEALGYATRCAVSHAERAAEILLSVPRVSIPSASEREALAALAAWPLSYLAEQIDTKVQPALRPLLDGGYSPSRRPA